MSGTRIEGDKSLSERKSTLVSTLQFQFPVSTQSNTFELFPLCNELGFQTIIASLKSIRMSETSETKVALLFGESNFISMMPVLLGFADVIVLADIEPRLYNDPRNLDHTNPNF